MFLISLTQKIHLILCFSDFCEGVHNSFGHKPFKLAIYFILMHTWSLLWLDLNDWSFWYEIAQEVRRSAKDRFLGGKKWFNGFITSKLNLKISPDLQIQIGLEIFQAALVVYFSGPWENSFRLWHHLNFL